MKGKLKSSKIERRAVTVNQTFAKKSIHMLREKEEKSYHTISSSVLLEDNH